MADTRTCEVKQRQLLNSAEKYGNTPSKNEKLFEVKQHVTSINSKFKFSVYGNNNDTLELGEVTDDNRTYKLCLKRCLQVKNFILSDGATL
jgi:hypothetical protein